jgi:hypothetical protein
LQNVSNPVGRFKGNCGNSLLKINGRFHLPMSDKVQQQRPMLDYSPDICGKSKLES